MRLDLGVTLFDMAKAAQVSSAMLSSIETGKKAAPESLIPDLAHAYDAISARRVELQRLADLTKKEVRMQLDERENATELAVAFARNFNQLSDAQIRKMKAMLDKAQ
jgi:transcriptional regulator with XRE-family HTH domain